MTKRRAVQASSQRRPAPWSPLWDELAVIVSDANRRARSAEAAQRGDGRG
jgi:hypothetical protein